MSANTTERIRVLIVDDHPVVRRGMNLFLGRQPDIEVVALAENGLQAVQLAEEFLPDVVLMDLNMPDNLSFNSQIFSLVRFAGRRSRCAIAISVRSATRPPQRIRPSRRSSV